MERIIIKNFGGITELDIELKPINIFIGKQASGKSVTVKLVYFFKTVFASFFRTAQEQLSTTEYFEKMRSSFYQYFPEYLWRNSQFQIRFYWNEDYLEIFESNGLNFGASIHLLEYFRLAQELIQNAKKNDYPQLPNDIIPELNIYRHYANQIRTDLGEFAARYPLFIPAGRSFLAQAGRAIFTLLRHEIAIEVFLREFGNFYEQAKEVILERQNDEDWYGQVISLGSRILVAEYFRENGQDYLRHSDNRVVEIAQAASGQQETLPLIVALRSIPRFNWAGDGLSITIEEPEAHIFPSTQREIVELMSLVFNQSRYPVQYFITTHSPYILTSFNNLLYAGVLAADERVSKEAVHKIVPQEQILERGTVAAFEMSGGTAKSIMDEETGMIFAEYLDQVSEETSIQFGELLDLLP